MPTRTTSALFLCTAILLLVGGVTAAETATLAADDQATLRASTLDGGGLLAPAPGAADVGRGEPAGPGAVVLAFGSLLGGLWLVVGLLALAKGIGDASPRREPESLPPMPERAHRQTRRPAGWR